MKKYLAISKITFANILQYRYQFLVDQFRTAILLATLYFLWIQVFARNQNLFNYNKNEIITYLFLTALLRPLVLTSQADSIAGELQSWGKFFSYLIKPVGYFRYWLTVDIVYKVLNLTLTSLIVFAFIKLSSFSFQAPELVNFFLFIVAVLIGVLNYFFFATIISSTGFWTSQVWGLQFLMVLLIEFSSGAFFPIDVLPKVFVAAINLTPFPYLLYYPINIFLGKLTPIESIYVIMISLVWLVVLFSFSHLIFRKGLKVYEAWGG